MHPSKSPGQTAQSDQATAAVDHQQTQAAELGAQAVAPNKSTGFNPTTAAATAGTLVGLLLARRSR